MNDDRLYGMLKEGEDREIPFHEAAEYFIMLKVASGGLFPEELEQLHELSEQEKTAGIHPDEITHAQEKGFISGVRGATRGDVAHAAAVKRKRGERIGKVLGSLGGAGAGLALGGKKKLPAAAVGALLGYTGGKAAGEEVDRARIRSAYKKKEAAAEEKKPPMTSREKASRTNTGGALGGFGGVLAGGGAALAGAGALDRSRVLSRVHPAAQMALGAGLGAAGMYGGYKGGKALGKHLGRRSWKKEDAKRKAAEIEKQSDFDKESAVRDRLRKMAEEKKKKGPSGLALAGGGAALGGAVGGAVGHRTGKKLVEKGLKTKAYQEAAAAG
jgi:hypothetical protein